MLKDWLHHDDFEGDNKIQLVYGGRPYFTLLEELIQSAIEEIHFQTYIFEIDQTGERILQLLVAASRRGVQVYLALDAFGSARLSKKDLNRIRESGIHFYYFGRFFSDNLSWGRRMHHKVVVIDRQATLIGGINISNRYNDVKGNRAWLDYAVLVRGPLAQQAWRRCRQVLGKRTRRIPRPRGVEKKPVLARLRTNDWLRGKAQITLSFIRAIRHARKSITIMAAYFTPTTTLMTELRKAAERGVKVRIILSRHSDVWLEKRATRYLYGWMHRRHFAIYEWKPTVLHAKVAVVDDLWATVGSYNLNFLSIFESLELNVEIADELFARTLNDELETVMAAECDLVDDQDYQHQKIRDWLAFKFYGWLGRLFNLLDRRPPGTKKMPLRRLLMEWTDWE